MFFNALWWWAITDTTSAGPVCVCACAENMNTDAHTHVTGKINLIHSH